GALIYRVAGVVLAHPDVTETKLLAGKVTLVHRALWPRVVAVGVAREDWQTGGLSPQAVALLAAVDAAGEVRTDAADAPRTGTVAAASTPKAARELERALLVHAEQVHSASGAHAKVLRTWDRWSAAHGVTEPLPPVRAAKDELNRVLGRLNQRWGTRLRLPWPSGGGRP
ncbi:MAG TPA: hypothetical protein VG245_08850, partial [Candidatus Dormibacteraeota bacterium]|nr:hypothetical protein [Candidatus Dormibacteraeota bacterium]